MSGASSSMGREPRTAGAAVIVAARRTAIGRSDPRRGAFRALASDDLLAATLAAVVAGEGVGPDAIEDIVIGCTRPRGDRGADVARTAALMAGLPLSVAGTIVQRGGGSGLEAIARGAHAVVAGGVRVVAAGGVEAMQEPSGDAPRDLHPRALARTSRGVLSTGLTIEHLAATAGISRRRQEEWTLESHRRAAAASADGWFDTEIVPVEGYDDRGCPARVTRDQSIDAGLRHETLAGLAPSFLPGRGTITSGTTAPAGDGAALLVLMDADEARRRGIVPLARIVASAVVGVPPALAGTGAVAAIRAVLATGAVAIDDVDHVEIDEAFAAQVIHNVDTLGLDPARVNPLGGSLALGRPRGASGARIVTTLLHALARGGGRVGAAAASVGFGQGIALLVEREPA